MTCLSSPTRFPRHSILVNLVLRTWGELNGLAGKDGELF